MFLEKTKLKYDSSNDADLVRDLRIILIVAQKNYVLDAPLGDRPIAGADAHIMNIWQSSIWWLLNSLVHHALRLRTETSKTFWTLITHKYRGSQQFSRVEYSTQIYRFDTRGAKEFLNVLAAKLSIQPHLEINYLQQSDQ